eukprot:TRINITY_DN189_c0_g1_i1.p1 TRINITY_DN189_c0_g1~~TRINITY_DN189_c0_g1_i1.p1  ORF type:complete len:470 (+),score=91.45 TRINITY_DN189_c0_g1_i1:222-1631(+)
MNPRVKETTYAVRGELVIRAEKHKQTLSNKATRESLPFQEIVFCNIGNPQELGQKPISFIRQVLSLLENPELIETAPSAFPSDVIQRAKLLLSNIPGGTGAYSNSQGLQIVRQNVAKFIEQRDGHPSSADDIYLSDGASPAVQRVLNCLISKPSDGIMIPIPQYPLYSASIPLYGGTQLNYYLEEEKAWGMKVSELEAVVKDAKSKQITPKALVIINPGNPTGQCLEEENMKEVIDFCHKNRLILLADEVYQTNSYIRPFSSFKKVLRDLGPKYNDFELISFHSISKGVIGECGKRGGYMECIGIHPQVRDEFYKLASVSLCSNVVGQVIVDLMVNPPKEGEPSYPKYRSEYDAIFQSLKRRANSLTTALNKLEGVTCNPAEGAMYLFPQIRLPSRAVAEAKKQGKAPDAMYCIDLLDATGICVVPGSGFGQKDGTYHFRTTFLPPEDKIQEVVSRMSKFHADFLTKWK